MIPLNSFGDQQGRLLRVVMIYQYMYSMAAMAPNRPEWGSTEAIAEKG